MRKRDARVKHVISLASITCCRAGLRRDHQVHLTAPNPGHGRYIPDRADGLLEQEWIGGFD